MGDPGAFSCFQVLRTVKLELLSDRAYSPKYREGCSGTVTRQSFPMVLLGLTHAKAGRMLLRLSCMNEPFSLQPMKFL